VTGASSAGPRTSDLAADRVQNIDQAIEMRSMDEPRSSCASQNVQRGDLEPAGDAGVANQSAATEPHQDDDLAAETANEQVARPICSRPAPRWSRRPTLAAEKVLS